ncbi:MAG: HAD family hydrolase [Methanobacteriota archaeon]|nr:MAG: HAD family hydrolase [Euryarchaeota archaeon]
MFDVGGVFRDTRHLLWKSFKEPLEKRGIEFDFTQDEVWHLRGIHTITGCLDFLLFVLRGGATYKKELLSSSYVEAVSLAEEILSSPPIYPIKKEEIMRIADERRAIFYGNHEVEQIAGEKRVNLLKKLSTTYRIAVVSNAAMSSLARDVPDVISSVEIVVSGDIAEEKKPSPKPLLQALSFLNAKAHNSIYVGDGVNDVIAARAAGCKFYGVLTGMSNELWLTEAGADAIYDNIGDLLEDITSNLP